MDLLNPPVGSIIDYTYRGNEGWIEVLNVGTNKILFNDNFKDLRDHEIDFRLSTWKVHMESTLENVQFRNLTDSTWEV
jgi:hypothetical protein